MFTRAVRRAGILTGDVTLHTLGHTAMSRMIEKGDNDHVVIAISGHSSTECWSDTRIRTEALKADALTSFSLPRVTTGSQRPEQPTHDLAELVNC